MCAFGLSKRSPRFYDIMIVFIYIYFFVAVDGLEYRCDPLLGANPGDVSCGPGDDEITVHINDNGSVLTSMLYGSNT